MDRSACQETKQMVEFVTRYKRYACGFRKLWPQTEESIPEIMATLSLNK